MPVCLLPGSSAAFVHQWKPAFQGPVCTASHMYCMAETHVSVCMAVADSTPSVLSCYSFSVTPSHPHRPTSRVSQGSCSHKSTFLHSPLPTPHSPLLTPHSLLPTPHCPLLTPYSPLLTPHSPLPTPYSALPTLLPTWCHPALIRPP